MKKFLLLTSLFYYNIIQAQVPEDVLRSSYYTQNGTARVLAIGGAMGSLGGDITATFVNPAGLGMFRTGEFVFSPSYFLNNNKTGFRETNNNSNRYSFNFGPVGVIVGGESENRKGKIVNRAISLAFTQVANFNNSVSYKGYNNYSSHSEQWVEEFANSGQSVDGFIDNPAYAFTGAPAVYSLLVDTFTENSIEVIRSRPEFLLANGNALLQENNINTRGGMYELALGIATNNNDKWLFGGTIGMPIMAYRSITTFKESDTSSNTNNGFGYYTYTDNQKTNGVGVNLRLGVIYKPQEYIRLGFALHSPNIMLSLKDERNTALEVDIEDPQLGVQNYTSDFFLTSDYPRQSRYTLLTPWKAIISGSYVFREVEDVTRQRAFVTADIEYLRHSASSFYSAGEIVTDQEKDYYKALNKVVRNEYKGVFNFRVGGELKFNTIMGRLGFAYYGDPYKEKALKASKMLLSGGIGYRNKGFFIDLTYIHAINKDVNFPYRLADKSNTFASVKNVRGNIAATVGLKF